MVLSRMFDKTETLRPFEILLVIFCQRLPLVYSRTFMTTSKLEELLPHILLKDFIKLLFFINGCDVPCSSEKYPNRRDLFTYLFSKTAMRSLLRNRTIVFYDLDPLNQKQNSIIHPFVHISDTRPIDLK